MTRRSFFARLLTAAAAIPFIGKRLSPKPLRYNSEMERWLHKRVLREGKS